MAKNWLQEAMAPIQAVNREIVKNETWGYLAPESRRKYYGWVLVAVGCYGDTIVVNDQFEGLANSPWQYEDLQEFVGKATSGFDVGIYRFDGWYKRFKNGRCQFGGGRFERLTLS